MKSMKYTLRIPEPVAWPGDAVLVENYRCRPPRMVSGDVTSVAYHLAGDRSALGQWHYEVLVDPETKGACSYLVTASDTFGRIEPL